MAGIAIKDKLSGALIRIRVPDADTFFVVDGKRIYMSFHDYCGPSFYYDRDHRNQINYNDYPPEHKLWSRFEKWHRKYRKAQEKRLKQYEDSCNRRAGFYRDAPVQLTLDLRPRRPGIRRPN
jgi:hypothetical protein